MTDIHLMMKNIVKMINWWKYSYINASLEEKKRWLIIHIQLIKNYIHELKGGDEKLGP